MFQKTFISVILPLKLEWEPCYYTIEEVECGERVRIAFAGKEYIGVVSGVNISPDIDSKRIKPVISHEKDLEHIRPEEIELWRQVSSYYLCSIGEVYKAAYPYVRTNMEQSRGAALRKVAEKREKILCSIDLKVEKLNERLRIKTELADKVKDGTKAKARYLSDIENIRIKIKESYEKRAIAANACKPVTGIPESADPSDTVCLSLAQAKAYESIKYGFKAGKPILLHGVAGSGKTEIYIRLAADALSCNKNVLYLVPEIALSRQLEERLKKHFGNRLIAFHSGETPASRRNSAEIIRNIKSEEGGGYVALCTRSGLFLPHHDLGLIIVDEEHDSSYKQDSPAPRYNGRDTALMLSRIHDCNIILGSATPSLEELYNTEINRHVSVRLVEKYHGSEDADIEIIDTKAERRKRGMAGNFSRKLIEYINNALECGEQVLILRSRRAWATILQCEKCGEIQKCPHCNVSMSYHKSNDKMVCHYCGHSIPYTGTCLKCGGPVNGLGAGTQKIEEEAAALFPSAHISRLDSDTTHDKNREIEIIRDFAEGKTDILIGTQIITKGFDFANLSLVAVIAADAMLGIQDFRADEKALQILQQFRGRCGRRGKKGMLVIQTSQPEHPIYRSVSNSESGLSSIDLLVERKDFAFPPYTRIIELTIKDMYEDRAERMASRLAAHLKGFELTGPYSPVIDKVADRYIRKIRISMKKDRNLNSEKLRLNNSIRDFEKKNRYDGHIVIDVDPA